MTLTNSFTVTNSKLEPVFLTANGVYDVSSMSASQGAAWTTAYDNYQDAPPLIADECDATVAPARPSVLALLGGPSLYKTLYPDLFVTPIAPATDFTPEEIADRLLQFALQNKIDKQWLFDLNERGTAVGANVELKKVFNNPTMNGLLDHPENYKSISDLTAALEANQEKIIESLTFWQKLKYGPQIKKLMKDIDSQHQFFDDLITEYAKLSPVTQGQGVVNFFCNFIRKDRLDARATEIFRLFQEKLKNIVVRGRSLPRNFPVS